MTLIHMLIFQDEMRIKNPPGMPEDFCVELLKVRSKGKIPLALAMP